MSDPKSFTKSLLFAIIMLVCIVVNIISMVKSIRVRSTGAFVFSVMALAVCVFAFVLDIIQMVNSY